MKFILMAVAAMILSTSVMARQPGAEGGDGGSGTFDRAMQHNDYAMEQWRAKH